MAASLLKRCPSCLQNLVQHLCDFTCSDRQSEFIEVISTNINPISKKGNFILFYCLGDFIFKFVLFM